MTQPDQLHPSTAANFSSLAEWAAKTQEDWEAELYAAHESHFLDFEGGILAILSQIPIIGDIIDVLTGIVGSDISDLSSWADLLLGSDSPLNAFNLFNLDDLLFGIITGTGTAPGPGIDTVPYTLPFMLVDTENALPQTLPFTLTENTLPNTVPYTLPFTLGPGSKSELATFFYNLLAFLKVDLTDPDLDLAAAIEEFISDVLTPTGLLATPEELNNLVDAIFQALTDTLRIDNTLSDLATALKNIPFLNVLGIGGPVNIGASLESTWDQLIGGFVGAIGSGAGLTDLFNIGNMVSSNATLGRFSWDVLGIRSNKPFWGGLLPNGVSNIPLPLHTSTAPTFALTQSTATTSFHKVDESSPKGAISWTGSGVGSLTHFFVNIFRMDNAGVMTLVHSSPNIIGDVSPTLGWNLYELQDGEGTPTPLDVVAGETYGIELAVRGAGTHNVVGQETWLPNHPTVFPRNLAAVRNSGTSAPPSTIAAGSVAYSTNVAFVEFAISAGEHDNREPVTRLFNAAGSTTAAIPSWANYVDVIGVGGGAGGGGGGVFGLGLDNGGGAGAWATMTWARDTDFTGGSVSVTVGAGGNPGGTVFGNPADGGDTVVSLTGTGDIITAGGGNTANGHEYGDGSGSRTYRGVTYRGGGNQNSAGANGVAPGGGGASGPDLIGGDGGAGAPGAVWLVFRQ